LTTGNSSDKFTEDSSPQAILFLKTVIIYFIVAESEAHPKGRGQLEALAFLSHMHNFTFV
jgi:hypothetical protein